MLTKSASTGVMIPATRESGIAPATAVKKVVIVNGTPDILELCEAALDAGRYDVVFVESDAHAYSQVKRVRPNLVILCVNIEDMGGFQVLSMLKLDSETRQIPVLTYATEYDHDGAAEPPGPCDDEILRFKPAVRMN